MRRARNIFAEQQVGQFSKLAGTSQLMEDGAQSEEPSDAGGCGQRWIPSAQMRHPSEEMRIAAELFEASDLRMFGAEINEEATYHDVVVALAGRRECGRQGLDRVREDGRQRMLERGAAPTLHGAIPGWG